jgi:cytochrome b561
MTATQTKKQSHSDWDRTTRWAHALLAGGIVLQLLLSLIMPHPGKVTSAEISYWFLISHEVLGGGLLVLVLWHWIRIFTPASQSHREHLFSPLRERRKLLADIQQLKRGRLPELNTRGGLVGLVHLLGLLVATAMVVTGTGVFLFLETTGVSSLAYTLATNLHGFFATFMWLYLAGHVGATLLHEWRGQHLMRDMFKL